MDHYAKYLKEKKNFVLEEYPEGFFTWFDMNEQSVYIDIVYIAEEHRGKGLMRIWFNDLMRKIPSTKTFLFCDVETKDLQASESMQALLNFGCKIHKIEGDKIVMYYNIRGEV